MLLWVSELLSAPDPLCVPEMFAGSLACWRDGGEDSAPCCFHPPPNPWALPLTPVAFWPPLVGVLADPPLLGVGAGGWAGARRGTPV